MINCDLSIIIVSWRVPDLLRCCLRSIIDETKNIEYEIIVIDNNSGDGTLSLLKNEYPDIKIIANEWNAGFAYANNQGIKIAQGKYILLLNPDTLVLDRALEKMTVYLKEHPTAAIAGCQLKNPDGTCQPSVRRFPGLIDQAVMMFKLHHLISLRRYLWTNFDYGRESVVDQIMGAFMIIRREAIETIGLLDDRYRIWFEEVDFCRRAQKKHLNVVYTPVAQIIHYGGQSFKQAGGIKKQWLFSASRLRYCRKHLSFLTFLIILLLTPVSLLFSVINDLAINRHD